MSADVVMGGAAWADVPFGDTPSGTDGAGGDATYLLLRTTNGLKVRDGFTSLSGWAAADGWTVDATRPIYVAYTSDVPIIEAGSIGSDDGSGPREGHLMQVSSSLWYLWYGAGDGNTGGAGAPWRPQLAKSIDKGVSWTKLGPIPGVTNGSYAARDNAGYIWKEGGVYRMHVLNAVGQAYGIPDVPYHNAIYSATDPEGTWTFVRETPALGGGGEFDEVSVNVTWTELIGGTYHHYWSARTANVSLDPAWAVGHGTSSTPDGAITKDGAGNFMGTSVTGTNRSRPENAKKWHSDALGKYVLASNVVDPSSEFTRANDIWYADSQTDFKDNVYRSRAQDVSWPGFDGINAVGLISPFCDESGQAVQVDGYVPFTWDADPPESFNGAGNVGFHRGRRIRAGVLEPAVGAAKVVSDGTAEFLVRSQANADFIAEFALEVSSTASSGLVGFAYRMSAGGGETFNGYLLSIDVAADALALHRNDGGSYTLVGSVARTATKSEDSINLHVERWKVVVSGDTHSLYLNGDETPVLALTDATYASGSYVAFRSTTDAKVRLFGMREADAVTINGLSPGDSVVLRGHGGVVIDTTTADGSGVASITHKHFPLYGFTINGIDYQPVDGGLVWGGDVYDYDVSGVVAFRSLSSVPYGIRTNTTVAVPDGVVDGDLLILVHLTGNPGTAPAATLPAGFTLLDGFPSTVTDSGSFQVTTRIAYKIASGEGSSYTVTHDNGRSEALLFDIYGAASSAPQATINSGTGDTSTATGLSTADNGAMVAFIAHNWGLYGSGEPPVGSTPTFTERFDTDTGLIYLATGPMETAGATGDKTQANGNGFPSDQWSAFLLAIEPAAQLTFTARAYYDLIGMTSC